MHTIVIANGDLPHLPLPLPEHDRVVAADGGAGHALRFGIVPDDVIGDLDSVTDEELARIERDGGRIHSFPEDKDETDLELALDFAAASGAGRITCYGLFGGRWDMTFANLLLLASPRYAGIRLEAAVGGTRVHILRGTETLSLKGAPGAAVSVLPLDGPAAGLTYTGLAWPLEDADLPFSSPRGVSNRMEGAAATISLREGVVMVFVTGSSP